VRVGERVPAHKSAGMDALSAMSRAILFKIDRFLWEEYCEHAAQSNWNGCVALGRV
jgi:hypothetical protein